MNRKKANTKETVTENEEFGLLDINEFVTKGKSGMIAYTAYNSIPELVINQGDTVFVDPSEKFNKSATILFEHNNRHFVGEVMLPLRLVAKNGKPINGATGSDISGEILGAVVGFLRVF